MPQQIVFTNKEEDQIVMSVAAKEKISKAEAIKKMIRDFKVN